MRKSGNNQANYLSGSGLACMASEEQTIQAFNFKSNLQTTPSICQPFAEHQYNRKCWSAAATSGAATTGELYFRFLFLRKSGKSRWVSYCLQWFNEFFFPIPQQQQTQFIRATQSAPGTPAKLTGLTAVIRAQQPGMPAAPSPIVATSIASPAAVARTPPIIHQQPKVHIQAGQQQQSIVLPIRTTPMTTQGSVTAAVTSVSFPVTNQQLTTALPNHPTGAIQTVKIGGGQAQVPNSYTGVSPIKVSFTHRYIRQIITIQKSLFPLIFLSKHIS